MRNDEYHKIQIDFTAIPIIAGAKDAVYLDGVKLRGVRGIKIDTWYNKVTEVTITMIANVSGSINAVPAVLMDSEVAPE